MLSKCCLSQRFGFKWGYGLFLGQATHLSLCPALMGIGSGFDLGGSCILLGGGGRALNLSLVGSPACVLLPPGPRLPRPSSPLLQRCSVSGLSASPPPSGSQSCVHVADFWDTAGQERFQSMHASYYHKAHACIMV